MACVNCVKYLPIDSFGPYLIWTQYVSDTRLKSWCTWSGLWMRHDEKWKSIYWQLLLSALIVMMRNHIVKAYGISKVAVINDCNLRGLRQQELCFLLFFEDQRSNSEGQQDWIHSGRMRRIHALAHRPLGGCWQSLTGCVSLISTFLVTSFLGLLPRIKRSTFLVALSHPLYCVWICDSDEACANI